MTPWRATGLDPVPQLLRRKLGAEQSPDETSALALPLPIVEPLLPLLSLRSEAIRQQGQVHGSALHPTRCRLDGPEMILEDGVGVVEEPSDERRLAVIDAPYRGEPQQIQILVRHG